MGRQRLNRWLDELTAEGVLECEVDDEGEMLWIIPGAARTATGPRTFAELGRGPAGARGASVGRASRDAARRNRARDDDDDTIASLGRAAMTLATKGGSLERGKKGEDDGKKSLAVSAGLSLLGPLGWLYAGSLKEAAIASAVAVLVWKIMPTFLLMPILYLALPLSAVVGLVYAWQYNRKGERTTLFLGGKKDGKDDD
ncbi:MAG TPA: hypothetical protein VNO33_06480 [Kofleriaceae bacterium]|nr:hypothetical protein [Kofleriaceae bacterium]